MAGCCDCRVCEGYFGVTGLVREVLAAIVAHIICGIACLCASSCLSRHGVHRVSRCGHNGVGEGYLSIAGFIREIFAAVIAYIICGIAGLRTGGSLGRHGVHRMSRCGNYGIVEGNFVFACLVRIIFSAAGTLIVCGVTCFRAGRLYRRDGSHVVRVRFRLIVGRTGRKCRRHGNSRESRAHRS